MFAFTGEVEWPDDRDNKQVNKKITEEEDSSRYESEERTADDDDRADCHTAGVVGSLTQAEPGCLNLAARLLPGERLGVVGSAIRQEEKDADPSHGRANVSVVSASYAKKLRLRDVPDHDRNLEVRDINPGTLEICRLALVKITLGWERAYEFEMWIMDHSAGVDVVLGTDFMIPAGVRLDLFHGIARLPDEVMVPLIKSSIASDDERYGTHVTGGPAEDLRIPGHEWREFRLPRLRPSYEVWIRRTSRLVPTVTKYRRG
ncbi:hypothetical protein PHMEG_00041678, partial [Phytophthora megakarya]